MPDSAPNPRRKAHDRPALSLPSPAPLRPPTGFVARCAEMGIEFEADDLERLGAYLALLLEVNKSINLTAIRDPDEAWTRHIFDSLTLLAILADLPDGARVIDVGSGGGLPGIPLAIVMPALRFTLLEATGKKAEFLGRASEALRLPNTLVVAQRAERAGQDRGTRTAHGREGGHRETYDAVLARAVGPMSVVLELTVPLARVGGLVLLTKGERAAQEITEAAHALHVLKAVVDQTVATPTGTIVVISKSSATPREYPRRDGEPKRRPLGGANDD
ncbi:MAG: 16S rRNA (guanine(527)-N(7))-methyltransferase RsmG [Phycisphaeraceae bacterium]|nr:16S rRNA (guanine(527)-N(7))-methyltransferase RsmG [Phycisphaeraceae bacterium]